MTTEAHFAFGGHPFNHRDDFYALVRGGIHTKEQLLDELSRVLHLPSYFGFNWNALDECLRDLHWIGKARVILDHESTPDLPNDELAVYLAILNDAIVDWFGDPGHTLVVNFPLSDKGRVSRQLP